MASSSSDWGGDYSNSSDDDNSVISHDDNSSKKIRKDRGSAHEKWILNRTKNLVVPLELDDVRRSKKTGITIKFDKVVSFRLPSAFQQDKKSKNKLEYSLHVSFFHTTSQRFFGNTWESPSLKAPKGLSPKKAVKLELGEFFVSFWTKMSDPACLAVVEVVVAELDPSGTEVLGHYGCGWTSLPVFSMIPDLTTKGIKRKVQLYSGSPRALLFVGNDKKSQASAQLEHIEGCTFSFTCAQDSQILKLSHLIRLNELVGPKQIIPGLKPIKGAAIYPTRPGATLHLLPTSDLYVNTVSILLPVNWEDRVQEYLQSRKGVLPDSDKTGSFSIKIAPHNGRCVMAKSGWVETKLMPMDYGAHPEFDTVLRHSQPLRLKGVVRDPGVAVACQVEYSVPVGGKRVTFVLGCGIWLPFADKARKIMLSNCTAKTVPTRCPLQIPLQTDLQCPFTDSGVFLPLGARDNSTRPILGVRLAMKPEKVKAFLDSSSDEDEKKKRKKKRGESSFSSSSQSESSFSSSEGEEDWSNDLFSSKNKKKEEDSSDGLWSEGDEETDPAQWSKSRRRKTNRRKGKQQRRISDLQQLTAGAMLSSTAPAQVMNVQDSLLTQTLGMKMHDTTSSPVARGYSGVTYDPSSTTKSTPQSQKHAQVLNSSLTRASRTILGQHGFNNVSDTGEARLRNVATSGLVGRDIDMELRDKLKSNEITLQFAAYRNVLDHVNSIRPGSVFFTFQFFNCLPTRTEIMALRASTNHREKHSDVEPLSGLSKPYILTRGGDSRYRNSPSLALKFVVDTTTGGEEEPLQFAKYLHDKTLFIHVWDGESLLNLGSIAFPLRNLMRQGEKVVKVAQEYDVILPRNEINASGVQDVDIYNSTLGRGELNGKVQIIATNYGLKGAGPKRSKANSSNKENKGIDWRVQSVFSASTLKSPTKHEGPVHRVVARQLTHANPELESLIKTAGSSSRRKLIHPQSTRKRKKQQAIQDRALQSEWTLTENELGRLDKALDRENRGQVTVESLQEYISLNDMMGKDSSQVWLKIKDCDSLTTETYRVFNDLDTDNVGSVTPEEFSSVLKVLDLEDSELDSLCSQFGEGDRVNYERFMLRVLGNEAGDLESKLRRVLRSAAMSNGISIKDAFQNHFDLDGDGTLERSELEKGLKSLGFHATKNQVALLMQRYGDGDTLRFSDFAAIADTHDGHAIVVKPKNTLSIVDKVRKIILTAKQKGIEVKKTFEHFDKDGNGELTKEECEEGLKSIGVAVSKSEMEELFDQLDFGHENVVRLDQFMQFLSRGGSEEAVSGTNEENKQPSLEEKMRKIVLRAKKQGISLEDTFQHFDKDGTGKITADGCMQGLKEMGLDVEKSEMMRMFKAWDVDGDGTVEFEEFIAFASAQNWETRLRDILKRAKENNIDPKQSFSHFDKDGKGEVSVENFKLALKDLGFEGTEAEFTVLVNKFDRDGDGTISYKEFLQFGVGPTSPSSSSRKSGAKEVKAVEKEVKAVDIVERLRKILRTASSRGIDINESFAFFDQEGTDVISARELKKALRKLGFKLKSDAELDQLMSHFDDNHDGSIDIEEFKRFVFSSTGGDDNASGARKPPVFTFLEENAERLKKMCRRYDRKDDGTVSFSRFVKLMHDIGWEHGLSLKDIKGFVVDHDRVEFEKFGSDSIRKKITKAVERALRKGISVKDLINARDRARTGKLSILDLHQFLIDLGFAVLEDKQWLDSVESDETTSRQLARINQLRRSRTIRSDKQGVFDDLLLNDDDDDETFGRKGTEFDIIRRYREGHKRDLVGSLLKSAMTKEVSIYPSFAKPAYFEVLITNPYSHEERFKISISDAELQCVTSGEHWRFLRDHIHQVWKDPGLVDNFYPVEDEMITPETFELTLDANESVAVPFMFLSFASGAVTPSSKYTGGNTQSPPIKERVIPVRVTSATHGHHILVIQVQVSPKPFVVDRVLYLTGVNNEYVKASIRLCDDVHASERFVHSLDPNAVVEWRDVGLLMKYRATVDSTGEFHVLVYNDPFHADLAFIWHVHVQPMQRIDCHGVLGQSTSKELIVKGDRFSRRVQVYSSSPGETELLPSGPFQLVAGAYNRVELIYRPLGQTAPGSTKQMRIHMVDTDSHELITSWLVKATAAIPDVTKTFEIQLPLHRISNKKIAYVNPWHEKRVFRVRTSDPVYVKAKQPQVEIEGKSKGYIRLWFGAIHKPILKEILLFINDQDDQNEECLLIKAKYAATG